MPLTEEEMLREIGGQGKHPIARMFNAVKRSFLLRWYRFSEKRPRLAKAIYLVVFFLVFSVGVTIWQYIVMTFLPYAFASLNDGPWGWPNLPVPLAGGQPYIIFGDAQGLGYFIAFEIAVFTAQCINFPLQRNVTYRSHGNPFVQALWYFLGWALVSAFTSALWGIMNCFLVHWGVPDAVTGLVKTFLTGIVSMVVFFFIFLVIFPDNARIARKLRRRLMSKPSPALEAKALAFERKALIQERERELAGARSLAEAEVLRFTDALEEAREEARLRAEAAVLKLREARAALEAARGESGAA